LDKPGFLYLDYSYSAGSEFPDRSPGIVGNTGLLHDVASKESVDEFTRNINRGAGEALAESKNRFAKVSIFWFRVEYPSRTKLNLLSIFSRMTSK
jgi:hypothetical protein